MAGAAARGTLSQIILDEIALEGLEGITLPSLWVYISAAIEVAHPLPDALQQQVWTFLKSIAKHLEFFELPEDRPTVVLYKRFCQLDPDLGIPIALDAGPVRYKLAAIQDGNIMGSCLTYKERKSIAFEQLCDLSVAQVHETWGNKFVIVASQQQRSNALTPANMAMPSDITLTQYCLLEIIGRSRLNGETTSGALSLLDFYKDSAVVFYIKQKLVHCGLAASQPFDEIRNGRFMVTTLLTLPRFGTTQKSFLTQIIEKIFQLLKQAPDYRLPRIEVRSHFPSIDTHKSFKKFTMTHAFRRLFEMQQILPSELNKDNVVARKNPSSKERPIIYIVLRAPNLTVDELFSDDDKDETTDEFYDKKHYYVDIPLKDAFLRAVNRHGTRGCSQTEITNYLAADFTTVRQLVKKYIAKGVIASHIVDIGRQRINRYVTAEFAAARQKQTPDEERNQLECTEEPNLPDHENVTLADIPSISGRLRLCKYNKMPARFTTSQRQIARKMIVVQTINERCLLQVSDMRQVIQRAEKKQGLKDEMCQKSMRRLLFFMSEENIVRTYEFVLKYEEHVRIYRYVTHPKIGIEHDVLQRELTKLKNDLYLSIEERRLRSEAQARESKAKAMDKKAKAAAQLEEFLPPHLSKSPKFLISRYMHEFLFYIVVELNEYQRPLDITADLVQHWQQAEPSLQVREFLEQRAQEQPPPIAYTRDISWRTFIPPLPKYADKPAGWVYFMDAVDRMPLSLFNKIFRIAAGADQDIMDYLGHPIRQHYLMRQLPLNLQSQISRVQLQKVYTMVLKLLNHMGLVQVSERPNLKDQLIMWVFLNRRAQIVDTTSTEASYSRVNPEREYPSTMYTFSGLEEVHQYWTQLHRVCVYTKLGFRRGKIETQERSDMSYLRTVDFDEAPFFDTGSIPGDNQGAAGLSMRLFAHKMRSWSWLRHSNSNPSVKATTSVYNIGRHQIASLSATAHKKHGKQIRRKTRVHTHQLKAPSFLGSGGGGGANGNSATTVRLSAKKSRAPRDAIDRDALKNMRTLRVSWCAEEAEMLKIARAVYNYVAAPVPVLGMLSVGKICRDIMRRTIGSRDKTMQSCVRRIQFMVKNNRHLPEVLTWMHLLQTSAEMQCQYGDHFLKKLKQTYPNRVDFCEALEKHVICIMLYLYKYIHHSDTAISDGAPVAHFIIPDSIAEFSRHFQERAVLDPEQELYYANPASEFDLHVSVAMNVLHSSLCCVRDKTLYNIQAFEIYKDFSEDVLQCAFQKARSDSLVVAVKRKHIQLMPTQLAVPTYTLSMKYRLRLIFLKIPYRVYDALYTYFESALDALYGPSTSTNAAAKQTLELKSPHVGQLFFIGEGIAQNYWKASIKIPVNILTVDTDQPQNISSMDRMFDHYHSILDNAPQTEYTKHFESEVSEKQVRVKFHPANLSYKIQYCPYDVISKLPTRMLHFFCALDHLQQVVDINFSKLQRRDDELGIVVMECPFSCIMQHANYINAIERIVQEQRGVLSDLIELPPQKLLNLAASSGDTVVVQPSNLLTLVQMLESWWREKELPLERKDLGKISPTLRSNSKPIDWQQMCRDILEFNSHDENESERNDEYEPTLNKEERIVRAQDVFVVNLPTLSLGITDKLSAATEMVQHNGLTVPKLLLESEEQRDAILQKIISASYWKYTEHTFETLKPKLQELRMNVMEQQHLEEILNYIEARRLGVTAAELLLEFPYEQFLLLGLRLLCEHYLVKRVGVATHMYVHKNHIRPWVVHSFHIKRLERENLGGGVAGLKRKHDQSLKEAAETEALDEDTASGSKRTKLVETADADMSLGKRVPKPVQRFEGEAEVKVPKTEMAKDSVVMRPQPWLRLNGSINRRVLDCWLGTLLTECISRNGCSMHEICLRFPHMIPVDVMFLVEILCELKCVHLTQIEMQKVDIFSEYEDVKESSTNALYDPQRTYITTHVDAVLRMATFIGRKKYNTDFISNK